MRKLALLFICILSIQFTYATTTYLTFEVDAPTSENLIDIRYKKLNSEDFEIFRIKLKDDGKVSTVIDLPYQAFVDITLDQDQFRLYLKPGDDLKMKFLANAATSTLEFSGKGYENNQFLASYEKQFKNGGYWEYEAAYIKAQILYNNYALRDKSPGEYYKEIGKKNQEQLEYLSKPATKENANIDKELIEYLANDIKYTYETSKIGYLIANQKKMAPGDFDRVANHYNLKKDANTLSVDLMNHPAYFNYVHAYAHFLFLPEETNSVAVELAYYNEVEKNMSGRAKYYLLSKLMRNVYTYEGTTDLAKKKFADYKKECPYPEYTAAIEKLYGELIIEMPDIDAPNFMIRDEAGNITSLDHYKGQVVYVSFWASWCKPCINNFNKSVQLRAQLKKLGVVLLNVSIDLTDEIWKKALAKHNVYGNNVIAHEVDKVKQEYGLNSIPAYYIVNKNGKFAYLSDEENRDLIQEFKDLVEE